MPRSVHHDPAFHSRNRRRLAVHEHKSRGGKGFAIAANHHFPANCGEKFGMTGERAFAEKSGIGNMYRDGSFRKGKRKLGQSGYVVKMPMSEKDQGHGGMVGRDICYNRSRVPARIHDDKTV